MSEFADLLDVATRSLAAIASAEKPELHEHLDEVHRIADRLRKIGEEIAQQKP